MNTIRLLACLTVAAMLGTIAILTPAYGDTPTPMGDHLKLTGVVSRIQSDVVFAKTPWGQLTIGTTKKLGDIQVGDRVTIWLNDDNSVIDVHKGGDMAPQHTLLSGHLVYTTAAKNEIRLWTPEGKKAFPVAASAVARLNAIPEGSPVTVELNEAGQVIDVQKMFITVHVDPWMKKT